MKMKYEEFVSIMDESFNYKLDFKSWDREEFLQFCRDFFMVKQSIIWTKTSRNILQKNAKKPLTLVSEHSIIKT